MAWSLLKMGLRGNRADVQHIPKQGDLKSHYDIVIIGGGGHGLATAYYLAKDWGITNVAVLEKAYLAGGNTARNTTIVRVNYLTPEGTRFYDESLQMFRDLSHALDYNIMYRNVGISDPCPHRRRGAHGTLAGGGIRCRNPYPGGSHQAKDR